MGGAGKEYSGASRWRTRYERVRPQELNLIQVWNLGGSIARLSAATLSDHMEALREWKAAGRIRYLHHHIARSAVRRYRRCDAQVRPGFRALDYSIGDRIPEERLLPLAQEKGIAVLANRPFTTGGLFQRVAGKSLPPWAADFDITSWAQYFLKFIVSHPAVICAIPATNNPVHLRDNMGVCRGRLPDAPAREKMVQYFGSV